MPRSTTPVSACVQVLDEADLCRLQRTTRELCRAIGMHEAQVFDSVIAVSELAHGLLGAPPRRGRVELFSVRRADGPGLEVRAEGAAGARPHSRVGLALPRR